MNAQKERPAGPWTIDQHARLMVESRVMFDWLERHYQYEEGPGETDRPEYIELRALLAKIRGNA